MKDRFEKAKLVGHTRQILTEMAAWTDVIYGNGAAERLINMKPGRDPDCDDGGIAACIYRSEAVESRNWSISGSAGPVIERSLLLKQMSKVIDYLNTNIWHGDFRDFIDTKLILTPFHNLLDGAWSGFGDNEKFAFGYAIDEAVDPQIAAIILQALKTFFARVHFEIDSNNKDRLGEMTLSELAIISGLAEKTVRMAAIGQDKNPDLVTFKEGRMTFVTNEEAHRWLASKKIAYCPPQFTHKQLLPTVEPKSLDELGAYLRTVRENSEVQIKNFGDLLSWDETMIKAYEVLEDSAINCDITKFSTDVVIRLAQAICPKESATLVRIIDQLIHPRLIEIQIEQMTSNSVHQELEG